MKLTNMLIVHNCAQCQQASRPHAYATHRNTKDTIIRGKKILSPMLQFKEKMPNNAKSEWLVRDDAIW